MIYSKKLQNGAQSQKKVGISSSEIEQTKRAFRDAEMKK